MGTAREPLVGVGALVGVGILVAMVALTATKPQFVELEQVVMVDRNTKTNHFELSFSHRYPER